MVVHEPSVLETTPMDLPPEMVAILAAFAPLFSHPVWAKAQTLAVGAILATGQRTVCAVLRIMGLGQERHFDQLSPRPEPRRLVVLGRRPDPPGSHHRPDPPP